MLHLRLVAVLAACALFLPTLASEPVQAMPIVELSPTDQGSVVRRSGLFGNRYIHDASDMTVAPAASFTGEGFNDTRGYLIFDVSSITQPISDVTLTLLIGGTNGTTLTVNEVVAPTASFLFSFDLTEAPGDPVTNARLLMDDLGDGPLGTITLAPLAGGGFGVSTFGPGGVGAVSAAQAGDGLIAFGLSIAGNAAGSTVLDFLGASLFVTTVPEPSVAILLLSSLLATRVGRARA